uniref:Uncharacterized protein n=1 Tax=Trichogramma kaykai TaxID=54128 RepID=A0ABD2WU10_9HYME
MGELKCVCCFAMISENAQVRESRIFGSSSAGVAARDLHLVECTKYETRALIRSCARALLQITNVFNVRYINLSIGVEKSEPRLRARETLCSGRGARKIFRNSSCLRLVHDSRVACIYIYIYIYIYICQERRQ